jgi:2-oxo-4-hydroxy-4-carboxy--5-ureidoimidazoline (OHCU) decarboxylase
MTITKKTWKTMDEEEAVEMGKALSEVRRIAVDRI